MPVIPNEAELGRAAWVQAWGGIVVGAAGTAATLIAVVAALFIASTSERAQDRQEAVALYSEYLRLSIDHPELAQGVASTSPQFESYEWYVSTMVLACEQLLVAYESNEGWRETCRMQMCYHVDYLRAEHRHSDMLTADARVLLNQTETEKVCEK